MLLHLILISIEAIDMQRTDNLFFGTMDIWVQEIAESFQVAAFGKSGINSQMRLASTEALLEED